MVNHSKSMLIFSPKTTHGQRKHLSKLLQISFAKKLGKYLGTWVDPGRKKTEIYNQVTDNINHRTASWKVRLLSQSSRLTLVKSVLSASNIYLLSCIRLPQFICSKIDNRCIDFFGVLMRMDGGSICQTVILSSALSKKEDSVCGELRSSIHPFSLNSSGEF